MKSLGQRLLGLFTLLLCAALLNAGCDSRPPAAGRATGEPDVSIYDYRDTRKLVKAAWQAAKLVERDGPAAFATLHRDVGIEDERLYNLYVYLLDGTCLFHPERPDFVGKNLIDVTDTHGRKALRQVMAAVNDPQNPHGWVHYKWQPHEGLYPVDKSSCQFRVTMPDGRAVVVGGGIAAPLEEKMFAKFSVDSAAALLREQGAAGLEVIRDNKAPYQYREVRVFVLAEDGTTLVDPTFDLDTPRNLRDYRDLGGNYPFRTIFERLRNDDSCWVVMLDRSRYRRIMGKKSIYARLGTMDGRPVVVGAMTSLPKPVWAN